MKRDRVPSSLESWQIDGERLDEGVTAYAGLPMVIETWYALGMHKACAKHLKTRERQKGLTDAEWAEVVTALLMAGGKTGEDLEALSRDAGLCRLWPLIQRAQPRSLLNYLHRFHQAGSGEAEQGRAAIREEGTALEGLGKVNAHLIEKIQKRDKQGEATIDIDGSVHESWKKEALWTYEGVRGYQPVIAYWAEQGVILADQFRDGNVPAGMGNRSVVEKALAALPDGVEAKWVRGDSALYEQKLLRELDNEGIGFGISADVSEQLRAAILALPQKSWNRFTKRINGKTREDARKEWAEVAYVPDERSPKKDARPFRYIAIRITKKEPDLFGGSYLHFAVVTNRWDMDGNELLNWQRQRCGTVEWAHDLLKNDFAAKVFPSGRFGANAAWYRFNVLAFNMKVAMAKIGLPQYIRARPHTFRMHLLHLAGRVVSHSRRFSMILGSDGKAWRDLLQTYEESLALSI